MDAVVVHKHHATSHVHISAHLAVAHIGQMGHLRSIGNLAVLHLHKVAYAALAANLAAWAQKGVRPYLSMLANLALDHHRVFHHCAVSHTAIYNVAPLE